MTLGVGSIVSVGALYIEKLGGAFEVNQYLSGIFSIPMIIPVIMGVIFWRPQPWGALASMIVGVSLGIFLNSTDYFSWEMATLIEIIVCIAIFMGSGFFLSTDRIYNEKVKAFFIKLATPSPKDFDDDSNIVGGLLGLYAVAFVITGAMFIAMGIPSIEATSGKLSVGSGIICVIGALIFYQKSRVARRKV